MGLNELREEIEEGLPPPYRGEPLNLRGDLMDEISDHLGCAMDRERESGLDEREARRAVIERFGNPAEIIRKLWFEAMKERIMRDRIVMVSMIGLFIIALAVAAMMFRSIEQTQATNVALVTALQKISANAGGAGGTESSMIFAKLQLRQAPGNEIAKGVQVTLQGFAFGTTKEDVLTAVSDEKGEVQFGPIHYGKYRMDLKTDEMNSQQYPIFYPGKDTALTIQVPAPPRGKTRLEVNWPEEAGEDWLLVIMGDNNVYLGSTWSNNLVMAVDSGGKNYAGTSLAGIMNSDSSRKAIPPEAIKEPVDGYSIAGEKIKLNRMRLLKRHLDRGNPSANSEGIVYEVQSDFSTELEHAINATQADDILKLELPLKFEQAIMIATLEKKLDGQLIDPRLVDQLNGKLVDAYAILQDTALYESMDPGIGGKGPMMVFNQFPQSNSQPIHALYQLPEIEESKVQNPSLQIFLCLNVSGARRGIVENPGPIDLYRIISEWPENVLWPARPQTQPQPLMSVLFEEVQRWKIINVSEYYRTYPGSGRGYGVSLQFKEEGPASKGTCGYVFESRELIGNGNAQVKRPLVAVVQMDQKTSLTQSVKN